MPKAKKVVRKTSKPVRSVTHADVEHSVEAEPVEMSDMPPATKSTNNKSLIIGLIVVAVVAFLALNKSWFLAATINGRPVWRASLNKTMTDRFGKQTLEGIISEALIADAAQKAGVVITPQELEAKEKEVVSKLGSDVNLDDLLRVQGLSKADFDNQIKLQMTVERILGKDVQITDEDVRMFMASNEGTLVATDEEGQKKEAREALLNQKISEKLQPWFTELKNKAKIVRF